jgi:hypothetical protein
MRADGQPPHYINESGYDVTVLRLLAVATIAIMVSGCSFSSHNAPQPQSGASTQMTAAKRAEIEAANAPYVTALANGYKWMITGTAAEATTSANGTVHIDVGPGNGLSGRLVQAQRNSYRVRLTGSRSTSYFVDGCEDCGAGPTDPPISAPPTAPPNVGPCAAAGGVAYGYGPGSGCLGGPGNGTKLCGGTFWWYAPGKGRFVYDPGGGSDILADWVASDGQSRCQWGNPTPL